MTTFSWRTESRAETGPAPTGAPAAASVFVTDTVWGAGRPQVMVVCCSDGRLQECMDEFLQSHLNIRHYDRFYAPGGPGALAPSGYEFLRSGHYREDLAFLINQHGVRDLYLIFHGPAPDGPDHAVCAHYGRVLPGRPPDAVRAQQAADLADIQVYLRDQHAAVRVHPYRAEVCADGRVSFVTMG